MTEQYVRLVRETCSLLRQDPPELVPDANGVITSFLLVDAVEFGLHYLPTLDRDRFHVFVAFGRSPEESEREVLRRLMSVNGTLQRRNGSLFSLNPIDNTITYNYTCRLSLTHPARLARSLTAIATEAKDWREACRLEPGPVRSTARRTESAETWA